MTFHEVKTALLSIIILTYIQPLRGSELKNHNKSIYLNKIHTLKNEIKLELSTGSLSCTCGDTSPRKLYQTIRVKIKYNNETFEEVIIAINCKLRQAAIISLNGCKINSNTGKLEEIQEYNECAQLKWVDFDKYSLPVGPPFWDIANEYCQMYGR